MSAQPEDLAAGAASHALAGAQQAGGATRRETTQRAAGIRATREGRENNKGVKRRGRLRGIF
eukprot:2355167-Rhodomonas_salina.1